MALAMKPEQSRQAHVIEYASLLRERFASGLLSNLQPLNQWIVWKGKLEDGKRKKVPYITYTTEMPAPASKFRKAGERLISPCMRWKLATTQVLAL